MSALTFGEIVLGLREKGVPLAAAERAARRELGIEIDSGVPRGEARFVQNGRVAAKIVNLGDGATLDTNTSAGTARIIDPLEVGVLEGRVETLCDQLAQKCGAKVLRFSHPGKTKQTEGIADRLYCFVALGFAIWWEAKSEEGDQRPGQVQFEETVTSCGHQYRVGGFGDFKAWLIDRGIVERYEPDGTTPILVPR